MIKILQLFMILILKHALVVYKFEIALTIKGCISAQLSAFSKSDTLKGCKMNRELDFMLNLTYVPSLYLILNALSVSW